MTWKIELIVSRETLANFVELLETECVSVAYFEINEGHDWRINALCTSKPNLADINARVALLATLLNVSIPPIDIQESPNKDWLQENQRSFPPIEIGCFYLYGSHIKDTRPSDKIAFEIDAGMAFGTGSHPTTQGCLLALEKLKKANVTTNSALDMGCGSGILAFATAKLWNCPVTGVDNDPDAISVAQENAQKNDIPNLEFLVSEGFESIPSRQKFDVISANILANPLCEMAFKMSEHTKPEGHVILSGILEKQGERVINYYQDAGFSLVNQMTLGEWATLTLQRARHTSS